MQVTFTKTITVGKHEIVETAEVDGVSRDQMEKVLDELRRIVNKRLQDESEDRATT